MNFLPTKSLTYALFTVATLLGFWGYCFEFAYFARLKLIAHEYLTMKHFILSSASSIIPMLVVIFIYENVKRFFTKKIHTDPTKDVVEILKPEYFDKFIVLARVGATIAFVFLALVVALPAAGINLMIWPMFLYLAFLVLQSFIGVMLTSPNHARMPTILVFALSIAACFAAGGYGYAGSKKSETNGVLRDDLVVKIIKAPDGTLKIDAKPVNIPFPISLKYLNI